MPNQKDNSEVKKNFQERIKKEELGQFKTLRDVEVFTSKLKAKTADNGIGEKAYSALNKRQTTEREDLRETQAGQKQNAQRANADLSAPKVDMKELEQTLSTAEHNLSQNQGKELLSFRDNYVTSKEQFSRNASESPTPVKTISSPVKE